MAKRSKSQTELTIKQITEEALNQILTIGFEAMSYTTLSDATGISRTGISHHFPKKTDFLVKLDEQISEFFVEALDFSSTEALTTSWSSALKKEKYQAVLKLFFSLCGYTGCKIKQFKAISSANSQAQQSLGEDGEQCIAMLIGRAALMLMNR
ncbi:MAG: TetR/AcrR family transcriptional regulator [Parashewanella sp.]